MAKEAGISWTTCSVDGSDAAADDIKNDVTSMTIAINRGEFDWTGLDVNAHERGLGLGDCSIGMNGIFNDAADKSHATFGDVSTTAVARTVALTISGQSLATPSAPEMFPMSYDLNRAADGNFTWTVPLLLQDGIARAWA